MSKEVRTIVTRVSISLAAIGIILYSMRDKLHETVEILKFDVLWAWVGLAFGCYLIAQVLLAFRLQLVLKVQKIYLSLKEVIHLIFVGLFFNLFLPSAVGGDLAKAYYAYQHSGRKMASTTSILLDRIIGFVVIIGLALIAVLFFSREFNDIAVRRTILVFGAIVAILLVFLGSRRIAKRASSLFKGLIPSAKWRERLSDIYHAMNGYRHHLGILAISILISLFLQFVIIFMHYCVTMSLDVHIKPLIFFIIVPMISIISMAPSIGGLGVREAGAIYLFNKFMPSERAFALALLLDIIIYGLSLISGFFYALRGGLKKKEIREMEELE